MNKPELLAEVNDTIRRLAADVDPDDGEAWEFVCECGAEDCTERVGLPLTRYDELKSADIPLLAANHPVTQARRARQSALELRNDSIALREEASALKNQALHQQRRSKRIADKLEEP